MTDRPLNPQEQWVADLLRLLGFDVKLNYWIPGIQPRREIDVLARLGPLQIAFECKNYSREGVDNEDIAYFCAKLLHLNPALGVFVANSFRQENITYCRQHGILPITSQDIRAETERLTARKHQMAVSESTINLLAAMLRLLHDWTNYFDPTWPFHEKIYATQSFAKHNLIVVKSDLPGLFEYEHTESGAAFFKRLKSIVTTMEQTGIRAMLSSRNAIETIISQYTCNTRQTTFQGADALVMQGVGLYDEEGEVTAFARLLTSVLQDTLQTLKE